MLVQKVVRKFYVFFLTSFGAVCSKLKLNGAPNPRSECFIGNCQELTQVFTPLKQYLVDLILLVVSSRGGLECIGIRFSFSKFGTSALGGSNPV